MSTLRAQKLLKQLGEQFESRDFYTMSQIVGELVDDGFKCSTIAKETNIPDYQIRHLDRIYRRLVPEVSYLLKTGKITFSMARTIASMETKSQERLARESIAKHISVHQFRATKMGNPDRRLIKDLEKLGDQYSEITGLDIKIKPDTRNANAGNWIIHYHDLDMFDTIAEKLVGKIDN